MHDLSYSQEFKRKSLLDRDVEIYLIWNKAFDLIEQERYDKLDLLFEHVKKEENYSITSQLEICDRIEMSIDNKNNTLLSCQLTNLILSEVIINLRKVNELEDVAQKKMILRSIFKELISIQNELKENNFQLYKDIVNMIRVLNMVCPNASLYQKTITNFDMRKIKLEVC
jgi:hypothetical protein